MTGCVINDVVNLYVYVSIVCSFIVLLHKSHHDHHNHINVT